AFTVGGATVEVLSANSNSPGTANISEQAGSTLFITTTTATTFTIWMSASDFAQPAAPPAPSLFYESSLAVTSTTGTGAVGLESCIDQSNNLTPYNPANGTNGTGFANEPFCGTPADTLSNSEGYHLASSNSNTITDTVLSLGTPYSLAQKITFTLGAGSSLNVITSQSLEPVPEPVSVALLGGVLLLTGRAIQRKRKQQKTSV
ncbi:MAG: hypothetical protein WBY44_00855, partial [Bryobacteraceae bacterium]